VPDLNKAENAILDKLYEAVVAGDVKKTRKLVKNVVNQGVSANAALEKMKKAIEAVDAKYMRKELYSVDVATAFTAMQEAFKILEPHLEIKHANAVGKVIIGSLKGNIQGLGKDIVAAALRSAGFQVVDLGVNVSPETFVDAAVREKAQIIAVSVSVDRTVQFLEDLVSVLNRKKLKNKVRTVIGGRAVSEQTRKEYGIDAYVRDEWDCVRKVQELLGA
jgi:5-methyltetrahydrofolate--homocysteine methyltransferase